MCGRHFSRVQFLGSVRHGEVNVGGLALHCRSRAFALLRPAHFTPSSPPFVVSIRGPPSVFVDATRAGAAAPLGVEIWTRLIPVRNASRGPSDVLAPPNPRPTRNSRMILGHLAVTLCISLSKR